MALERMNKPDYKEKCSCGHSRASHVADGGAEIGGCSATIGDDERQCPCQQFTPKKMGGKTKTNKKRNNK